MPKLIKKNVERFAMVLLSLNLFIEINTGNGILFFLQLIGD